MFSRHQKDATTKETSFDKNTLPETPGKISTANRAKAYILYDYPLVKIKELMYRYNERNHLKVGIFQKMRYKLSAYENTPDQKLAKNPEVNIKLALPREKIERTNRPLKIKKQESLLNKPKEEFDDAQSRKCNQAKKELAYLALLEKAERNKARKRKIFTKDRR